MYILFLSVQYKTNLSYFLCYNKYLTLLRYHVLFMHYFFSSNFTDALISFLKCLFCFVKILYYKANSITKKNEWITLRQRIFMAFSFIKLYQLFWFFKTHKTVIFFKRLVKNFTIQKICPVTVKTIISIAVYFIQQKH